MFNVPKESLVVGYEMPNNRMELYASRRDPEMFDDDISASKVAKRLNAEPDSRFVGAVTEWKVYRMRFEGVEAEKPIDAGEPAKG